jgi:Autotransporter beta-domain
VWSRVGGGQMTTKSTAQDSLGGVSASLRVKTTYDAYEVGVDTGRLNISNSGWNGHFGVLGGSMSATSNEQLTGTNVKVDAPFVGGYGVLVNGPLALNFVGRYNWIDTHVTDVAANLNNTSLNGHSFNVTASGAYNIALPNRWFVAPTAGINFTQADFGQLATNVGQQGQGIAAGSITYDTLTSALVHAGARFGTTFQAADNLVLQPYGTLSVWHEMAGNWSATFAQQGGLADQFNLGRVGTFGQAGLGVVVQVPNSGFSGFARGDVQFGDKVDGTSVVGGLRYNFGP